MNIQNQFNKQAIDLLPNIKEIITTADQFESNQMRCAAIKIINNTYKPIEEMNNIEINHIQEEIISVFKYMEWLKK